MKIELMKPQILLLCIFFLLVGMILPIQSSIIQSSIEKFDPDFLMYILHGRTNKAGTRLPEVKAQYTNELKVYGVERIARNLATSLGWEGKFEGDEAKYLDIANFEDENVAQVSYNPFPWNIPNGAMGYALWLRFPAVSKATFELKEGEVFPSKRYYEPGRLEALLEYIEKFNMVGYVGPKNKEQLSEMEPLKDMHPPGHEHYEASNGHLVSREEAWEAHNFAGRHVNAYLKKRCGNQEVVWLKKPDVKKGIPAIEHIHFVVNHDGRRPLDSVKRFSTLGGFNAQGP